MDVLNIQFLLRRVSMWLLLEAAIETHNEFDKLESIIQNLKHYI